MATGTVGTPGRWARSWRVAVRVAAGLIELPAAYPSRQRGDADRFGRLSTLRTLDGDRELAEGELVACLTGRAGAHRIDNRSDAPVRLLVISTMLAPEINEYPDSGKVWARTWPPGQPQPEDAVDLLVRSDQEPVDYLDGES